MFQVKVNKQLIPMKMSYFLIHACVGPIIGFLPTIARQLGYSLTTYGAVLTFMSMVSMVLIPVTGIVVDRYRVKKKLFLTTVTGTCLVIILFVFVPKVPVDTIVELNCDTETTLTAYTENRQEATNKTFIEHKNVARFVRCELDCEETIFSNNKTNHIMNDQTDSCDDWMKSIHGTKHVNKYNQIDVTLKLNDTKQTENSYIFHVLTAEINGTKVPSTTCQCYSKTLCHNINCSDDAIMDLIAVKTYRGNVLNLYQFWIFFVILNVYWIVLTMSVMLINPICLDILDDKPEDYGKQKLWASIGWGFFSILIGWLVDLYSINKKEKDYSPVFYSGVILMACNIVVSTKIKVVETKKSKGKLESVYGLFTKHYVIAFYIWCALSSFFHTIVTHYLFWYMDDLVSGNNDQSQRDWLKTLQGLTQGIQCFGGEIPFFFCSGWIIRKIGHVNCMALALGAMAVRMYLYTVISNPAWIILIELLNGISFALGFSVKMSYSKIISPPHTANTVIGFTGFVDCIGESLGSLLGGYLFDSYGGVWSFRFFAYCSALMCCINIVTNFFGLTKDMKNSKIITGSKETDVKDVYTITEQTF